MKMKKGYLALLEEADAEVTAIPPQETATRLGVPGTVFVDLRDPRELEREGRFPGARSCSRGMLNSGSIRKAPDMGSGTSSI